MSGSRRRTWAGLAVLVAAALVALPAMAHALPADRAYEMVTPPDKNDGDVGLGSTAGPYYASYDGNRIAYMALGGFDAEANSLSGAYGAKRGDEFWVSRSALLRGLPYYIVDSQVTDAYSPDASRVVTETNRFIDTGERTPNGDAGIHYLLDFDTGEVETFIPPLDVSGNPVGNNFPIIVGSDDFSRAYFLSGSAFTEDALGVSGNKLYRWEDGEITLASRLPDDSPSMGTIVRPSSSTQVPYQSSSDGQVLFYTTTGATPGLWRRDYRGANPQTVMVNASENTDELVPTGAATFIGASEDGMRAYFTSNQKLVNEDTDTLVDLYLYDHAQPAGSRLTLISVDNEPGDDEAAVTRAHTVSRDGSTAVFASTSQLVPGEPTDAGQKLYVWRNNQLSFVANTAAQQVDATNGLALSPDGSRLAFVTNASVTADDNGGLNQVYTYDVATGALECLSCRGDGAANTAAGSLRQSAGLLWFGVTTGDVRNVSSEGEVFFETSESLLPQDTNGVRDVYIWEDGELDLISSGRSTRDSSFAGASLDGTTVFFTTREQLSGWDWDARIDIYAARVNGGLPEPPEPVAPCVGEDCQGPPPLPPIFGSPGSGQVDGPGNPQADPVDCTSAERKANRLANKAQQAGKKAKRLKKQARKASGKKAKRLGKRAKKAQRQAKAKRKQARQARNQLALCREEAEL